MWPITCSTKGWESSLSRLRPRIKRFSKRGWPRQARQNEACWLCCKGISVGLRDSERRRGGQRRIAQESDREVRILSRPPRATCPVSHEHFRESLSVVPL